MAYTALEKMRKMNLKEFGADLGPAQPYRYGGQAQGNDLKTAALRFIHDRCEELRFDKKTEKQEDETGAWQGASISPNQIPYNMQMDIDRLCLERELERFIDSGVADDAYNVYYCYLEMFFGRYGRSKKMVELLNEYETNGSSLLMKHRDHYSHSVYVFALGLAIYETNVNYRRAFNAFYGYDAKGDARDSRAANFFLEYWGLTSLFHDIGYPFELPFEQAMSYFEVNNQKRSKNSLLIAYKNVDALTALGDEAKARFEKLYGRTFHTIVELLAYDITKKLGDAYGFSEGYLMRVLDEKPQMPEHFNCFMDHAFFSAVRLYREITDAIGVDTEGEGTSAINELNPVHVDALSAILLHNSLYKFSIAFYKNEPPTKPKLPMNAHPLAWLLMLCDELQCWDRTAYGRNSRTELQPMGVRFDFSGNEIRAEYIYDEDEKDKIDAFNAKYAAWKANKKAGKQPKLKAYSSMVDDENSFAADIERIVDTSGAKLTVTVDPNGKANRGMKHIYLSASNFLHMHDFAAALNGRYAHEGHEDEVSSEQLDAEFEALSLEYKLYNINQVKSFSKYLNAIQCFYTDRPVDFDLLSEFTPEQVELFAPMEHERWVREHQEMGWRFGTEYNDVKVPRGASKGKYQKMLREHMRIHEDMMDGELTEERVQAHYKSLPEKEQGKDWQPFNSMLKLIRKYDGLRIYKLT